MGFGRRNVEGLGLGFRVEGFGLSEGLGILSSDDVRLFRWGYLHLLWDLPMSQTFKKTRVWGYTRGLVRTVGGFATV